MIAEEKQQLLGNLFREALYPSYTVPELMENFSKKISENFTSKDFLILQLASQLYESAQIRREAFNYMKMTASVSSTCYNLIAENHPGLHYCTTQRFKGFLSELYKRCERIFEGKSPEIKDLTALRVILYEPETQDTLKTCYQIAQEAMEKFSELNCSDKFPLYVNLSVPDKLVSKSNFDPVKHPNVLLPNEDIIIPELSNLGKDYIRNPKDKGYQAYHSSYELISKTDSKLRIFSEIQVTTIQQWKYKPANHDEYKEERNRRWDEIFYFDEAKVHLYGYYPQYNEDSSGLTKPLYVTQRANIL